MKLKKNIIAFIIIGTIGTLSHFIYEWADKNYFAGLIFPINESVWEHLKLLFFPFSVYSVIEYLSTKEKTDNYFQSTVFSVICGMFTIVAIYYIYTGVIGKNIDFLNILIYFIGVMVTLIKKNKIINQNKYNTTKFYIFSLSVWILISVMFIVFTYNPPSLGIFTPPVI